MAFRFRRSVKLMPGVRLNVGTKGLSVSAGVRGARATVGGRGATVSGGLPGTGIGFQRRIDQSSQQPSRGQETVNLQVSLRVEEDGSIGAYSKGEELPPRFVTAAFKQQPDETRQWLEGEAEQLNAPGRNIAEVHLETPPPVYCSRLVEAPFAEERPRRPPEEPYAIDPPAEPAEPRTAGIVRVIPGLAKNRLDRYRAERAGFEGALADWEEGKAAHEEVCRGKEAAYQQEVAEWRQRRAEHEEGERARVRDGESALTRDEGLMAKTLASRLGELNWPFETVASFEVRDLGRVVSLDVDLPEIEDLPETRAELSTTGKRLLIKKRSQADQRRLYALHIHGISLRLLGEVFACLPAVEEAFVSGYSQRLDASTGKRQDEYLLSVRVTREMFSRIDFGALEHVGPVEAVGEFDCRRKMTKTGVFQAVEPFDLDRRAPPDVLGDR